MNKFKMWLIPVLIAILAVGGLVYFRGEIPKTEVRQPEVTQEERVQPKSFAKQPEPSPREKAKMDSEAMVGALDSGSVLDCEKITWSEEARKQCEDNINYASILKSGDEDQCAKLNNAALKTQCYNKIYMTMAVDSQDPSICEKITDAALKQMCLDQVQMIVSRFADSADDCSVISADSLRRQCEDNYYLQTSTENLNVGGCDSISNPALLTQCRKTVTSNIAAVEQSKKAAESAAVAKTLREILTLCDDLTGSKATVCKDAIYPQLAFDEKNLSHCDKISDSEKASECRKDQGDKINAYFLRQSLASNDKALCDQILDTKLKLLCQSS